MIYNLCDQNKFSLETVNDHNNINDERNISDYTWIDS